MTLLLLAIAWLAGAAIGALGFESWWPAIVLGGAGLASGWALAGQRLRALLAAAMVVLAVLSLLRYEAALPPVTPEGIAVYNDGEPVRLLGTVSTEPEERLTTVRFVLEVAAVERDGAWVETHGRVLVSQRPHPRYAYGDIVEMTARLETPPAFETFDYRDYLARRGIVSTALFPSVSLWSSTGGNDARRWLYSARAPFGEALERVLPEPEAALAKGILLGQRSSIPVEVNEAFNVAGISHLIAISGYNVMLVAGAVIGVLTPLTGRRQATVIAMAIVVAYAIFVGADPPVLRAMLMALVMLGATLAGRPGSALTGVSLAGALLVLARPLIIDDVSFQLSFAATVGIVVLATPLRELLLRAFYARMPNAMASALADSLAVATAASVAVLPIIASAFGRVSLVSLAANVLAGPVFVAALFGSLVTAVTGAIDTGAGRVIGDVSYLPLHALVVLADVASRVPMASLSIDGFGWQGALLLYIALIALAKLLALAPKDVVAPGSLPRLGPVPALAVTSVVLAGWMWWSAIQPLDTHFRVSVLDVGQGDAILVQAPSGTRILIDGGLSPSRLMQALGEALQPHQRRIDLMVLTHSQDDHVTGLVEVFERYDVGAVLWNGQAGTSGASRTWLERVSGSGVPALVASAGQLIELGDGAYAEVLHPQGDLLEGTEDDLNNNSVVLRLVYGGVSFLLTGDIEADAEQAILDAGLDVRSTVLKVAHHGSDGATTPQFLEAVSPSVAVVSAGAGNAFGHPSPSLRLRLAGVPLLRTDLNGTVRFRTDGVRLWVDYEDGEIELLETREPAGVR